MEIKVGDIVNVTFVSGLLDNYEVITVPGNNEMYWELAPVNKPSELTIVGPALISIVKKDI